MIPLDENKDHLDALCDYFALGKRMRPAFSVRGGFHHFMWDVHTANGRYAIKQLAPDTDLDDCDVIRHYETAESVSEAFSRCGVPALHALGAGDNALQVIENCGYLIYPWTNARALRRDEIDVIHIHQIAGIFARMHGAVLKIEGLRSPQSESDPEAKLEVLLKFAQSRNSSRNEDIREHLPLFENILSRAEIASAELSSRKVVSHGDLDHKNVLWDSSQDPLLIDWESTQYVNPAHEVILEALDWSGITLDFKENLFDCFVDQYLSAGGQIHQNEIEAAFACVEGDWVNWLMYNLGRSIDRDDEKQRRIGLEQVDLALVAILHLQRVVPRLLSKLNPRSRANVNRLK
ncbi:phosphotransferase [Pseudohalioglobus lutimaris]|uniref:Aminoglycoside phosphotransferase n=1 Tax=Pseudohalioglobus lutimaris TaxID=1737061 RepID=A0A2N5X8R1_9GAMM|nr:phosphotransferase [Pseudohalioglobus lutimaris]PLW70887.1 aminoglycoside phosphotransferase [Pseudohalioglobus lutimaris]